MTDVPAHDITNLQLSPDTRLEHGRPAQSMSMHSTPAGGGVVIRHRDSVGKLHMFVIDTRDINAVCAGLQEVASQARAEWRDTIAGSETQALLERARTRTSA